MAPNTLTPSPQPPTSAYTIDEWSLSNDTHTYSAVIHAYGEVMEGGKRCFNFGGHYNPYGVSSNIFFFKSNCCFG